MSLGVIVKIKNIIVKSISELDPLAQIINVEVQIEIVAIYVLCFKVKFNNVLKIEDIVLDDSSRGSIEDLYEIFDFYDENGDEAHGKFNPAYMELELQARLIALEYLQPPCSSFSSATT